MKNIVLAVIAALVLSSFVLVHGQTALQTSVKIMNGSKIPDTGINISFLDVLEDSRCPIDVVCVWAGNARVKLQLEKEGRTKVIELNSMRKNGDVAFEGYQFSLVRLTPHRRASETTDRSQYLAVIRAVKQ